MTNTSIRKILMVNTQRGFIGGVERMMLKMVALMTEMKWQVYGLFEQGDTPDASFDDAFHEINVFKGSSLANLIGHYQSEGIDAVCIHKCSNSTWIRELRQAFPTAIVVHDHDYYCPRKHKYFPFRRINCHLPHHPLTCFICSPVHRNSLGKYSLSSILEPAGLKREAAMCDISFVLSGFMRDNLIQNGWSKDKIKLLVPHQDVAAAFTKPPTDIPQLLYVGQLIRGKGVDLLLRALAKLDRPFHCTIVGRGNDEAYLKDLARHEGISDKISFRGFTADIGEYYQQADMAIVPSRWQEPFGLVGLEAFAYQIPVIGFAVGGITEWLKHKVNGLAVREGDTSRLARAIRILIDDPAARKRYAAAGYALIHTWFTRTAFKESFIPHLEDLIKQWQSRRFQTEDGLDIFGIKLANLSMAEAMNIVETAIITRKQKEVFFVNADCLNKVFVDKDYHAILRDSKELFADGIGIKLAGKILGKPVRDNVNGTDMLPLLCEMAESNGYSMYLLGAAEGVAETMKTKLVLKYPRLKICGFRSGYFDHDKDSDIVIREINDSRPDILLVAFGAPLQEKFIRKHAQKIEASVLMGVGGLFDFYSGRIARAPYWMRQLGMEWVFRLMKEPRRMWKRYIIGNPVFLYRVFRWNKNRDFGGFGTM